MLRPFKNFVEFRIFTGCDIGTAITTRFKYGDDERTSLIVSFDDGAHTIGLGTTLYSYKELFDYFLLYNPLTAETKRLGVEEKEEQEEPEIENVKPAKFKVGCTYDDSDGNEYTIIAKYRNPVNKRLYIVVFDDNEDTHALDHKNYTQFVCMYNFMSIASIRYKKGVLMSV